MAGKGVRKWSRTAADNSDSDNTVAWPEGMAPSQVNDSARAEMASVAAWRDDTSGIITTAGSSTAYTLTSYQTFDALTAGDEIGFCLDETNGATVTLNVDGLGAKPLRPAPGVELVAGQLKAAVPYRATYYTSNSGEWILHGGRATPLTDLQITGATALTAPAVDDELPIYDLDTTTNKKITLANVLKVVNGLTQDTSPDKAADFALTYDASGSAAKKVLLASLSQALGSASGLGMGNNSGTPNTNVDIVATQAVLINPTGNVPLLVSSVSLTCNTTTGGSGTSTANGMDGTARGNSTWYHFFIISDGTTTASLCSSSPTAPSMPSGYVYWLRVGAMRTDGSGNFLRIQQVGNRSQYIVTGGTNTVLMPSLQSGALGTYSATAPTYAAVGVGNSVPTTARQIIVAVTNSYGAATAANVIVAPNSAYGGPQAANGSYPPFFAPSGANMVLTGSMNLESSSIYYASSAAGGAVNCLGWIDAVNAA